VAGNSLKPKVKTQVILGIDPGSHHTGFGAVRSDGDRVELLSYGVITPPAKLSFNERIAIIAGEVELLLEKVQPDVTVVERIFLGKNTDSAFKLGHTRGATIASAMRAGSQVVEYATRVVKKGITGNGNASKEEVQLILFAALHLKVKAQADASDALALAYYHARNIEVRIAEVASEQREADRSKSRGIEL
jgi:crossover junction endodeoxyribonuclease RuvC